MLSAAAVAAALGAAAVYVAGHEAFLGDVLARVGVLLAGVNLGGAALLYRPVRRFLAGDSARRDAANAHLRALPVLSALWLTALAAAVMAGHIGAVQGSWRALLSGGAAAYHTLGHVGLFAAYLGLYGYFVAVDCAIELRRELWNMGQPGPRRDGKLMHGLTAALAVVALGPVLIIAADQWLHGPETAVASVHRQLLMRQTLQMDLFGALILAAVLVWLISRRLSRPVSSLVAAMRHADQDGRAVDAPVVSDDEFGLLAEQFNRMLASLREHDRMRRTFARFVPESVAAALLAWEGVVAPQEREASVLFVDIEDFTRTASRFAPREILELLNDYFEEIGRIVDAHAGVITQFQGDAVLATFNLPLANPDHARDALEAACAIEAHLREASFAQGVRLRARTGVASGPLVGGTVGGGERLGYTVHGDTVNLAARLEELNKELGTRILASARTAELAGGAVPLRDVGEVAVRGFDVPLRVFEPVTGGGAVLATPSVPRGSQARLT
ncbi:MAG: adenylate/guanylate cyclase domain-containing protein [Betaproteobacteria bacterium]|nr:adenylate/guanylate cyclase domain-containing protein [Betaproteobacteria bacterium]